MRVTKLVLPFLLSLTLAAPPGVVAQSRGKGPDKGQGKAKVEKPQKPRHAKKPDRQSNRGRSAERQHEARKAPQRARPAPKAQKPPKAENPKGRQPQRARTPRKTAPDRELRDDARRAREHADRRIERRTPILRDRLRPIPRPQPDRVVRDVREDNLRFRGMDRNGDRRITRSEWRGNDVSFGNHDRNGDGILSGSEVTPGGHADRVSRTVTRDRLRIRDRDRRGDLRFFRDPLGHRIALAPAPLVTRIDRQFDLSRDLTRDRTRDRTRRFDADRVRYRAPERDLVRLDFGLDLDPIHRFHRVDAPSESLLDRLALPLTLLVTDALLSDVDTFVTVERFSSYDRDFDGYLAPAEWPAGNYAFDRYDLDDDGYLVSRELYADDDLIVIDRDRLLLFQGIDQDDDGLVAPWEWPGDLDSFWFRDHNADGAVSLDEYLGLDVDLPVRDLSFDAVDYDRDGEIARVEWVGDPYRFHRLDRNDNGVVGRWEYAFGWLRGA
jgi:hypothetical protein